MGKATMRITADDYASKTIDNVLSKLVGLDKGALKLGISFALASKAIEMGINAVSGVVTGSIDKYKQWETSIAKVYTLLDSQEKILFPAITAQIEELSLKTGEAADRLATAYQQIVKSGFDVVSSSTILNATTELSIAQGEDVVDTSRLVTLAMKQWGYSALNVNDLTEKLNTVLDETVYSVNDLAGDFSMLNPLAKEMGMNFDELLATLITLNREGVENVSRGFMQLANTFLTPTTEMIDKLGELGIAFDPLILQGEGVFKVLENIYDATDGNISKIGQLIGSSRTLAIVTALSSDEFQNYYNSLDMVKTKSDDLNSDFNAMMSTTEKNISVFGSAIESIQRGIGENLTGIFSQFKATTTEGMIESVKKQMSPEQWAKAYSEAQAGMKPKGYTGELAGEPLLKGLTWFSKTFQDTMTSMTAELQIAPITDYFDKASRAINAQSMSYQLAVATRQDYIDQRDELLKEQELMPVIKKYTDTLSFIPLALEDATYDTRIFDVSTQNLVKTIRDYNQDIKDVEEETNNYSQSLLLNNIAAMRIQLEGFNQRRGFTRGQQQQLKELEKSDLEYRISMAENQYDINDIRLNGLNTAVDSLDKIMIGYKVYLSDITDSYQKDYDALSTQIGNKEFLMKYYADVFIPEQYKTLVDMQTTFNDQLTEIEKQPGWTETAKQKIDDLVSYQRVAQLEIVRIREATTATAVNQGINWNNFNIIPTPVNPVESLYNRVRKGAGLPTRQMGGYIPETGPYLLHKGETVVPNNNNNTQTIIVNNNVRVDKISNDIDMNRLAAKLASATKAQLIRTNGTTKYGMR